MNSTGFAVSATRLVVTFCALATCASASAATIYVKADAAGANDGSSWNDAFRELDSALAAAQPGDELWVAAATYRPDAQSLSFELHSGVAVYGGFAGTETSREQRDFTTQVTTLSGALVTSSYHVVRAATADSTAILDGFTITGGDGGGTGLDHHGAGIFITGGGPTIANCMIRSNLAFLELSGDGIAGGHGGGVYCSSGAQPLFVNCGFDLNRAGDGSFSSSGQPGGAAGQGGAVYAVDSSPTFRSCTFTDNRSGHGGGSTQNGSAQAGGLGGAIFIENGALNLEFCVIQNNRTGNGGQGGSLRADCGSGAGLVAIDSTLFAHDCLILNNKCGFSNIGPGGSAGAMYLAGCPNVVVSYSTIASNNAGHGPLFPFVGGNGGAIVGTSTASNTTDLTLLNCSYRNNRAGNGGEDNVFSPAVGGHGGALYFTGNLTARDCDFINNFAGRAQSMVSATGGSAGVLHLSGTAEFSGCRISANAGGTVQGPGTLSLGPGGAILTTSGSSLQIANSEVSINQTGNSAGGQPGVGGAIRATGTVTLTNVTVAENRADDCGGVSLDPSAIATVTNCIFWENVDDTGEGERAQIELVSANDSVNYSCIQGLTVNLGGVGNIGSHPVFRSLTQNDYRLSDGSPCIDAAQNSAVPPGTTLDLSGEFRFVNDPDTSDTGVGTPPIVDMGAYEFPAAPLCPGDLDNDGAVGLGDLSILLSCFGREGRACADLNGDTITAIEDLALLLAAFGQACP